MHFSNLLNLKRELKVIIFILIDSFFLSVSFYFAFFLRTEYFINLNNFPYYYPYLIYNNFLIIFLLTINGFYRNTFRSDKNLRINKLKNFIIQYIIISQTAIILNNNIFNYKISTSVPLIQLFIFCLFLLIVRTYTSKLLTYLENYEANRAIYMIFIKNDLIDQILLNVDSKNMIFKGYITNNFKLFISSKLKNIYFIDQLDQILSTNKNIIIYSDFSNQIYLNKLLKNKVKIIFKNFADPKISNDKIEKKFDYFFNKKVLILGGAGSIGSGILNKLLEYNCNKIVIADISEINIFNIKNSYSFDSNVQFRLCDCTDYTSLSNIIDEYDIDIIFHCAANKHVLISENSHQHVLFNNIMSTINLIKIIKNNKKIMKLTYISTDKAVEPSNIMGLSKRIGEIFIKIEKLKSSNLRERINIVRFGNVIGSSGSLIPTYRDLIIKDKPLIVYGLKTRRFFMSLNEAVFLTIFSNSIYTKANEVLFFDMGEDIQIYDVAKKILNIYKPESSTEGKKFIKIKKLNKSEKVAEKLHYKSDKITNFEYESIKIVDESNSYDYKKLSLVYKNFSKKDFYFKKIDTKLLKDLYKMVSMN